MLESPLPLTTLESDFIPSAWSLSSLCGVPFLPETQTKTAKTPNLSTNTVFWGPLDPLSPGVSAEVLSTFPRAPTTAFHHLIILRCIPCWAVGDTARAEPPDSLAAPAHSEELLHTDRARSHPPTQPCCANGRSSHAADVMSPF